MTFWACICLLVGSVMIGVVSGIIGGLWIARDMERLREDDKTGPYTDVNGRKMWRVTTPR